MQDIAKNLNEVKDRIASASRRSGRRPEDITLVAVTKTVDIPRIQEALAAGVTDIGENYIQESIDKWLAIGTGVKWHFIGHLQRNKAKNAVEIFDLIQSVDNLPLVEEIGKRATAAGKTQDILIEVNVSEEAAKFGAHVSEALDMVSQVSEIEGIRVLGLMGMAPFLDNPEDTRPYFAKLKEIWDRLPTEQRWYLSMGMTQDFEIAIEEGSNMIRIGTAIFGPRQL
ncbi:MAG: YggS family pyridoxal phosphate-dependent enzyme [Armatimonadota bacterium]|nr:YggS family pyridoxal phosphate-dependent enzyme [Armatimonadota bacterium]